MSYKISYGGTAEKNTGRRRAKVGLLVASVVVGILGAMARFWYPEETKQLMEALFPLTSDSSQQALRVFSENIRAGESFGDAVTAFCWEIIHESDIS